MAAVLTFNQFLNSTIGLNDAEKVLKYIENGLDDFGSMAELDDDDIKIMMNGIRKDPEDPTPINAIMEKRTKIACYGAKMYTLIGRPITAEALSLTRIKTIDIHKHIVKEQKDPKEDIPKVSRSYTIDKALDAFPTYLRSIIGVRGVALSYVVREGDTVQALGPLGAGVPYATESGSFMNELISNTPHSGGGWEEDNARVYSILAEMVKDVPMASSLKAHQRSRNGREAHKSLVKHNLGSAKWDVVIAKAEEVQSNHIWNGKNSRYSIRRHIDLHRDAYNDMVRAKDHVTYEAPNERTRVTRLLKSVQAGHIASIAAAKTTIEATPHMRDDFENAADFLILNAPAPKAMQHDYRVSAVLGDDDDDKSGEVEDRFYTDAEYQTLNGKQRYNLRMLRENRGKSGGGKYSKKRPGAGGDKDSRTKRRNQQKRARFKNMKSENDDLKQRIAALESKPSEDPPKKGTVQFNQRQGGNKA